MEFLLVLHDASILRSLPELLDNESPKVVKRTLRVITNVYKYSLQFISEGKLNPAEYEHCHPDFVVIFGKLSKMLDSSTNTGITVHLVNLFTVSSLQRVTCDLSKYSTIEQLTKPIYKLSVACLLRCVQSKATSGQALGVAVKGLISIAIRQANLRARVLSIVRGIVYCPPTNLHKHNIRSIHKIVYKNLNLLLAKCNKDDGKKVSNMITHVYVPRATPRSTNLINKQIAFANVIPASINGLNNTGKSMKPDRNLNSNERRVSNNPKRKDIHSNIGSLLNNHGRVTLKPGSESSFRTGTGTLSSAGITDSKNDSKILSKHNAGFSSKIDKASYQNLSVPPTKKNVGTCSKEIRKNSDVGLRKFSAFKSDLDVKLHNQVQSTSFAGTCSKMINGMSSNPTKTLTLKNNAKVTGEIMTEKAILTEVKKEPEAVISTSTSKIGSLKTYRRQNIDTKETLGRTKVLPHKCSKASRQPCKLMKGKSRLTGISNRLFTGRVRMKRLPLKRALVPAFIVKSEPSVFPPLGGPLYFTQDFDFREVFNAYYT